MCESRVCIHFREEEHFSARCKLQVKNASGTRRMQVASHDASHRGLRVLIGD